MAVDHEGVTINVGDGIFIPVYVDSVGATGVVTCHTAYGSSMTISVPGPDTHQGKPSTFPDLP